MIIWLFSGVYIIYFFHICIYRYFYKFIFTRIHNLQFESNDLVQNCFTALGDTMLKRFEREGTEWILHSCKSGHALSSRPFSRTDTFGHFWTPWALGALHKFHPAYMSLASQVMSQWIKHSYSLQRQGRLGKTPRLGQRGQLSEARSFHSFNANVALHIIIIIIMLPSLKQKKSPENWWLEDYFRLGKAYFQGLCLF